MTEFPLGTIVYVTIVGMDGENGYWTTGVVIGDLESLPIVDCVNGLRVPLRPEYLHSVQPGTAPPTPEWLERMAARIHGRDQDNGG